MYILCLKKMYFPTSTVVGLHIGVAVFSSVVDFYKTGIKNESDSLSETLIWLKLELEW